MWKWAVGKRMGRRRLENPGQVKLTGVFRTPGTLLEALRTLKRTEGVRIDTIFSPVPLSEIHDILGDGPSPVRFFTLFGGILGIALGLGLGVYAHLQWKFISSGKPVLGWVPFVVVAFEGCILVSIVITFAAMLILGRLPRLRLPVTHDIRFSQGRFGLVLDCSEEEKGRMADLLKASGAEEVNVSHE
jgi:hypothetical protein